MSNKKLLIGIFLIIFTMIIPFLTILPNFYSNNSAGKIHKNIDTNFNFLKEETKPYVLLYFGYVGCYTVCPPALNEISQIYKKIDKNKFSFYFINLQPDTPEENVDQFAKVFHKDFKGIYLNNKEIIEIVSKLNVKYLPSMVDTYDIDHSGFLHILRKNNKLYSQEFLYTTRPFDIDYIINDLNSL